MTLKRRFVQFRPRLGSVFFKKTKTGTEKELGRLLGTIERLQQKPEMTRYFSYRVSSDSTPVEVARVSISAMVAVSRDIHAIEQQHSQQLWRLAGKIVEKMYGENVLEHMPDYEIHPIQPSIETQDVGPKERLGKRSLKQARQNLSVLRLQQLLSEGSAIHAQSRLLQAHSRELQQIDPRLPELYAAQDALARVSHFVYLAVPNAVGQKMEGGRAVTQTKFLELVSKTDPAKHFLLPQSFAVQELRGISFMVAVHELANAMALMNSKKKLMLLKGKKAKGKKNLFVPLSKHQQEWIARNLERTQNVVHSYVFGPAVLREFRRIVPFVARLPRGKLDVQTERQAQEALKKIGLWSNTEETRRIVEVYGQFLELSPKTQQSLFNGMANAKTLEQKQRIARAMQNAIRKKPKSGP